MQCSNCGFVYQDILPQCPQCGKANDGGVPRRKSQNDPTWGSQGQMEWPQANAGRPPMPAPMQGASDRMRDMPPQGMNQGMGAMRQTPDFQDAPPMNNSWGTGFQDQAQGNPEPRYNAGRMRDEMRSPARKPEPEHWDFDDDYDEEPRSGRRRSRKDAKKAAKEERASRRAAEKEQEAREAAAEAAMADSIPEENGISTDARDQLLPALCLAFGIAGLIICPVIAPIIALVLSKVAQNNGLACCLTRAGKVCALASIIISICVVAAAFILPFLLSLIGISAPTQPTLDNINGLI